MQDFFHPLPLAHHDPVLAVPLESRPPGEAYVRFRRVEDAERGMRRHKALMGKRFIEVFKVVDAAELEEARSRQWCTLEEAADRLNVDKSWEDGWKEEDGFVVRLRGLPWEATTRDVRDFFAPIQLDDADIDVCKTEAGRQTGEAFVRLRDRDAMLRAMQKNRRLMGRRYIEVFASTLREFEQPQERKELDRRAIMPAPPPSAFASRSSFPARDAKGAAPYAGRAGPPPPPFAGGARPPPPASAMPSRLPRSEQAARDGFMSFYGRSGRDSSSRKGPVGQQYVVRVRGLSFGTTERDMYDFFSPIPLSALHIIVDSAGRPSGEAYAELESEEDELSAKQADPCAPVARCAVVSAVLMLPLSLPAVTSLQSRPGAPSSVDGQAVHRSLPQLTGQRSSARRL